MDVSFVYLTFSSFIFVGGSILPLSYIHPLSCLPLFCFYKIDVLGGDGGARL